MQRRRRCSKQTLTLLAVLTDVQRGWQHGYELSQATHLKSGTLYPILMRLADRGLLESKWVPAPQQGRPPRHMYRLTKMGVAFANEQIAATSHRQRAAMQPQRAST
jgi:PadR family transcriptional regulator